MQSILLHVILLIAEINGAVYLRRQRRKTDNDIETTNNNSLARTAVNKYTGFESESGSGVNSGSGLGEIYQNGGKLSFSTSSGSGAQKMQRESEQMDESLQQLMNDNEDTSNAAENISFSGSGKRGSQHTEAESTDDVTDDLRFSGMSGRGSVDESANQENFETADPVTEGTYGSGGFEKKDGGDERPTISKRSLEKNDQSMTLLESFFAMNSNEDDSEKRLATSKRDSEQNKEEIEVQMRKRSVEDLGDETIPNLSYIKRDEENEKAEKFEENTKSMGKRNVMDADNSVRFLDDMITRDLFNDKEAKMIERITRGLNNDASSRDTNPIETYTHDISKQHHMNSVVSPRDEHKAKGISRDAKKQNGGSQNSKKHVKVEANKRENNLSRIAKRDAVGDRNINDRKYSKKDSANFKDTLKGIEVKRREILERIPVRSPHIGLLQKRDLILDSDTDADIFMASAGKTKYDMKEKRFVRADDTPEMWRRPSQRYANFISDKITDLTPLNNEYLENMKRQNILMNKNAERLADKQVDLPLIGTFAKPTKVVGIWSGLGSEPVFIEKHYQPESDESGSGSGTVSDTGLKSDASGDGHDAQERFKPEDVGNIMGTEVGNEMIVHEAKNIKITKKGREESEKKRRKRMDKEEENKYDVNKGTSQVVLAFDEVHEIVPKRKMMKKSTVPTNKQFKNVDKNEHQFTKKKAAKSDKKKNDESKEWNDDSKDADDGDWDDASGDEESGDEETEKHVRSDSEDEVVVKTLSAKYKKNEENYKRDLIIIKRAPEDNGYLGCFVDVLNPVRDLSVRAGIPFVTINNCRSACKRTGYYYAGLQFGYLCFCGNSYGKYDMAPDSECNYQCSGNGQQTCGGLWRNSIYSTAGSPDDSREGPVPIYLSAQDKANSVPLNTTNTRRSEIPAAENTTTTSTTSPTLNSTTSYQFQATQQPPYNTGGAQNNDTGIPNNVGVEGKNESNEVRIDGGKRKVLMHFAYLHPQHDSKLEPTGSPLPTPPLRIEPQTRVFKGAIKLKQKWFDEFKDKMSTKSLILAGNVEQALKNIYTNNTQFHDFLKAEVLSFREGIIKNNPDTIRKVVVEFALTFNQNAISPDARLFSTVRAKKRLDEMPVYPSTLKVSEYRFDPNSPNQAFKIPVKESLINADDNASDEDRRKSFISLPDTANNQPLPGFQPLDRNEPSSQGIKELQSYLSGEASSTGQNEAALATQNLEAQLQQQQQETGNEREISGGGSAELSKRANIPNLEESQKKIPYILRLFFWKDMLARKKRLSSNERIPPLTRERRGDLDTSASLFESNTNDNVSNSNRLNSRLDNNQQPLTQESSFERRFVTKTKRKTKDLTTEKELKRSKRLDQFESEFD